MQTSTTNQIESRPGLVISFFGNSVAVEAQDGQVFQCYLRRNQELPVVGDRVNWQLAQDNTGTIVEIMPRRSVLARGDAKGKLKPLAANIDLITIVMAPPPIFSEYLIDRYLVAAALLNIQPLLVLNKTDLLTHASAEEAQKRLAAYQAIPCATVATSVLTTSGLQQLASLLADKTSVLVGPSGVGKSSIIAALGVSNAIRIGEVSTKGSGKHTTTATTLYHLPQGGDLIDSPGVREFNLWPIQNEEVLRGFRELQPYAAQCRFRDCKHTVEPGCRVQEAVADGRIARERFDSYLALMKESTKTTNKY